MKDGEATIPDNHGLFAAWPARKRRTRKGKIERSGVSDST